MIRLTNYNGKSKKQTTSFFIQSKGLDAGKVLNEPIANCFEVEIDKNVLDENYAFYLVSAVYYKGCFKKYVKGTAVPYITIKDGLKAINDFFK